MAWRQAGPESQNSDQTSHPSKMRVRSSWNNRRFWWRLRFEVGRKQGNAVTTNMIWQCKKSPSIREARATKNNILYCFIMALSVYMWAFIAYKMFPSFSVDMWNIPNPLQPVQDTVFYGVKQKRATAASKFKCLAKVSQSSKPRRTRIKLRNRWVSKLESTLASEARDAVSFSAGWNVSGRECRVTCSEI